MTDGLVKFFLPSPSDVEEVGSSRETSPLQLLEELCFRRGNMRDERFKDDRTALPATTRDERTALPATTRDERTAISPGTVSTARRKFEQNNNNRINNNSSSINNNKNNSNNNSDNSDVESDKFARERSSTEKLRGILQAEGAGSGGLSSVSLLHLGTRQQAEEEEGSGGLSKVSLLHLETRQQPGEEEGSGGLSSVSLLHLGTRQQAEEEEGSGGLSKDLLLHLGTRQLPEEVGGGEALSPQNQIKVKNLNFFKRIQDHMNIKWRER